MSRIIYHLGVLQVQYANGDSVNWFRGVVESGATGLVTTLDYGFSLVTQPLKSYKGVPGTIRRAEPRVMS